MLNWFLNLSMQYFGPPFFGTRFVASRDSWAFSIHDKYDFSKRRSCFLACRLEVFQWLKYLLSHEQCSFVQRRAVRTSDRDGWALLKNATEQGNVDYVSLLLAYGADVNARQHDGHGRSYDSILEYGMRSGNLDVVRLLVEHGANIEMANTITDKLRNRIYSGPLCEASEMSHHMIALYLLEHGADFDPYDRGDILRSEIPSVLTTSRWYDVYWTRNLSAYEDEEG